MKRTLLIATPERGFTDITASINEALTEMDAMDGLCHIFLHHTSASLCIMENADPAVLNDLETFVSDLVEDGDPRFTHRDEGPDDMSAHVRTLLTHTDLSIPVNAGRLDLGIWQGVFVWEHRTSSHRRRVTVTFLG